MKLARLSESAFNALAATTRLRDRSETMAKAVLVDGRQPIDVAEEFGVSRQLVYQAVTSIEKAAGDFSNVPSGTIVRVESDVPVEILGDLKMILAQLEKKPDGLDIATKAFIKLRADLSKK